MEGLLDSPHSVGAICVLLSLHLLVKIGEFAFSLLKKKNETTEKQINEISQRVNEISLALTQNTQAARDLRIQIGILEREITDLAKLKMDTNKLFSVVKILAAAKWPKISKMVATDIANK